MDTKENRKITVSTGWWGHLLAIAIIAIRAFQPGAEPMSSWSFVSWMLMTLPVTWPFAVMVLWGLAVLAVEIFLAFFPKRR